MYGRHVLIITKRTNEYENVKLPDTEDTEANVHTQIDIHITVRRHKKKTYTNDRYVLFDIERRPFYIDRAEEKMKPSKQIKLINIEEKYLRDEKKKTFNRLTESHKKEMKK